MRKSLCILLPFLVSSLQIKQTISVKYTVTNNVPNHPGGVRFDQEIGIPYTIRTMETINQFIWDLFQELSNDERKNVPVLNVQIADFNWAVGYANGDAFINISASAIKSFPPGRARFAFTSLMYHEMTHIFQWSGNRTAPDGLLEGTADYVMVKSKYYFPDSYGKPGEGSKWDEGYDITERFLEYCDGLKEGFTIELNKKMRYAYRDDYFVELLGKPVEQLWAEYKAKYKNIPASGVSSAYTDSCIDFLSLVSIYFLTLVYFLRAQ